MAKKMDEAEVKKECPSCGLGVALDATICEFCGWDFEEEDEWILQIEKLERDLMLEKQKFEPGTVNHMIESTLHAPVLEKPGTATPPAEAKPRVGTREGPAPTLGPAPPITPPAEAKEEGAVLAAMPGRTRVRRVRTVKAPSAPTTVAEATRVRRVRGAAPAPAAKEPEPEKKTRGVIGGLLFSREKERETEEVRALRRVKK